MHGAPAGQAVLLGNGFSRAYDDTIFSYSALRDAVEFPERLEAVFETVGSTDFELVMRRLGDTREIIYHYADGDERRRLRAEILQDIGIVRRSLISALREHHPAGAHELDQERAERCSQYLAQFETIFTLNYDLLLYWVFLEYLRDQHCDGFGGSPLTWQDGLNRQTVYYLHGALHLYNENLRIRKIRSGAGTPILDSLATNMAAGRFPLFVSEGSSEQKLERILSNQYLLHAYRRLEQNCSPLTIYGFNFSPQDRHLVNAIARSQTPSIEVVLHSGSSDANRNRMRRLATTLAERIRLPGGGRATIRFSESDVASVWD